MTPTVPARWEFPHPEPPIALTPSEVHVWRYGLDPPEATLDAWRYTLDPKEQARAERYRTPRLQHRFVAGRVGLRIILSAYLGQAPEEVAFTYGDHGKPGLSSTSGLEFNLTHSNGLALCAVARDRRVGVDVEGRREMENAAGIIGRFFSAAEQAEFLALPEGERPDAFYRGWTRKEAFLKAVGTGLATALDSFDVNLAANEPPRLLRCGDDPAEADRWTMVDLDAGPGFAAALVVRREGLPCELSLFDGMPAIRSGAPRWG